MRWGFRARGKLGVLLLLPPVILTSFAQPIIRPGSWTEVLVLSLGWAAFALGILFRFWSTLYVGGRKRVELVCEGPYSICRNPLYVGSFCSALAAGLFLQSLSFIAVLAIVAGFYACFTVPAEESDLRAIHGRAYEEYCRSVPRFWPKFSRFRTEPMLEVTVKGLRLELKRAMFWFLLPVLGSMVCHLRYQDWWPHTFHLL